MGKHEDTKRRYLAGVLAGKNHQQAAEYAESTASGINYLMRTDEAFSVEVRRAREASGGFRAGSGRRVDVPTVADYTGYITPEVEAAFRALATAIWRAKPTQD